MIKQQQKRRKEYNLVFIDLAKAFNQEMIKQQKRRKEYNLVFIDLAKAFNTIPHKSIDKGLWRKGIPEQVRETLMEKYSGVTTRISIGEKVTRQIKIRAGVKQGYPLSPLLFNLIIDELLEKLRS